MKFYIETYGCQMNVADSELLISILSRAGHLMVKDINAADLIFIQYLLCACTRRRTCVGTHIQ